MDYVLVSKKNNKIVCVIELDDPSHERADRMAAFVRASVTKLDETPGLGYPGKKARRGRH